MALTLPSLLKTPLILESHAIRLHPTPITLHGSHRVRPVTFTGVAPAILCGDNICPLRSGLPIIIHMA